MLYHGSIVLHSADSAAGSSSNTASAAGFIAAHQVINRSDVKTTLCCCLPAVPCLAAYLPMCKWCCMSQLCGDWSAELHLLQRHGSFLHARNWQRFTCHFCRCGCSCFCQLLEQVHLVDVLRREVTVEQAQQQQQQNEPQQVWHQVTSACLAQLPEPCSSGQSCVLVNMCYVRTCQPHCQQCNCSGVPASYLGNVVSVSNKLCVVRCSYWCHPAMLLLSCRGCRAVLASSAVWSSSCRAYMALMQCWQH